MGDGRIFLKIFCSSLFNDDLSNEPNFGQIHLAGQYLLGEGTYYKQMFIRGGQRHLQIGRMLDIYLISEPPPPPTAPPDVCIQSVGMCVARGAGSDS